MYLLDTHVFLWWIGDDPRLSGQTIDALASASVAVFVSSGSIWEIAIKAGKGRLRFGPEEAIEATAANAFRRLDFSFEHAAQVRLLPAHHADPFDRMLLAQAIVERLTLVTVDRKLAAYDVPILWG